MSSYTFECMWIVLYMNKYHENHGKFCMSIEHTCLSIGKIHSARSSVGQTTKKE